LKRSEAESHKEVQSVNIDTEHKVPIDSTSGEDDSPLPEVELPLLSLPAEDAGEVDEHLLPEQEEAEAPSSPAEESEIEEGSPLPEHEASESPSSSASGDRSTGDERPLPERKALSLFTRPTRAQLQTWTPFWAVILLGAILRFWGLGDKPLHHDESLHAYFSLMLLKYNVHDWIDCFNSTLTAYCYRYDPLTHGPFQFHAIAFVYQISQLLGAPDHGINTTTVRIAAATLGTVIVGLPYFLRDRLGTIGAWLACFLLAISPSMVYFSRFAREDIYMACFTLLLVVAMARYLRTRKLSWLMWVVLAFSLSYATKEATFLTVAVFGSFLGALLVWEIGIKRSLAVVGPQPLRLPMKHAVVGPQPLRLPMKHAVVGPQPLRLPMKHVWKRYLPRTAAPLAVLLYFVVLMPVAVAFFELLKNLSIYVTEPQNKQASDLFAQNLEDKTTLVVPWIGIVLGIYVLSLLIREMSGKLPPRGWWARHFDLQRQPLLYTIFTTSWTYWFFALLAGWAVFLILFTVLFTNIKDGIADGIWQGIYYWVQQQQVARGGQPWYYYFLLIPLYEQIGLIFGLVGCVRCLLRPTRFRLFLVYWFVGNVFIYSWAAEKMPWLMIHMTMPMMLLAAIGLEPAVVTLVHLAQDQLLAFRNLSADTGSEQDPIPALPVQGVSGLAGSGAVLTVVLAVLLLLPTLQNMYEVTYVHAADGPHEMMVYVQTTTDINTIMSRIAALDQMLYAGKHLVSIGVADSATWPLIWYLRDYSNVCYSFPSGCPGNGQAVQVIVTGEDDMNKLVSQYASGAAPEFAFHQYHMRTWWNEGYKPPACVPSAQNNCAGQPQWGGVGLGLWLSYGDVPPPHSQFNLGLAALHIWQWWWQRRPFGATDGSYDMGLLIRSDLHVAP
jgi:uncharacterized protein (TIGR03663 family)